MKKGTRKFLSIVVVLVIALGAFVSLKGIGPVQRLADKLRPRKRVRSCLS